MSVFTPAERDAHIAHAIQLMQTVQSVRPIEEGYEFLFPNETQIMTEIAEFIGRERLCCPFLDFALKVPPPNEPLSFALTGPTGTQEFLRAEFEGAFSKK